MPPASKTTGSQKTNAPAMRLTRQRQILLDLMIRLASISMRKASITWRAKKTRS